MYIKKTKLSKCICSALVINLEELYLSHTSSFLQNIKRPKTFTYPPLKIPRGRPEGNDGSDEL